MTRDIFGTDGIRGAANIEPMTAATALRVAMATGHRFLRGDHRHLVVIGKDTRLSGYMLEPAMTAGFISMGMDVVLVGPLPTPAVAMLTRSLRADLGVVLSASHNPYQDNGIKLFGPDGYKLSDTVEREIEERMDNGVEEHLAASGQLGKAMRLDDAQGRYIEYVKNTFPKGLRLDGMKVVIDCAHGAAYRVAPLVLWELGAEVIPLGTQPDGFNINRDCGATEPQAMCAKVVESGADIGIALDGDADRLIISDEKGNVIDGDQVMALVAVDWKDAGHLRGNALVATIMSNMGLERYLAGLDLGLVRAQVGDRYVVETMRSGGHNVGGEQSGHIILSDYSTTGDGLIAALQVLSVLVKTGRPASEVVRCFDPFPQMLRSVSFNGAEPLENSEVKAAIAEGEAELGGNGRLVIRKSGTEPLIRVMAEAEDEAVVGGVVERIIEVIERVSG
jgi:phosphoglucosamine mutase